MPSRGHFTQQSATFWAQVIEFGQAQQEIIRFLHLLLETSFESGFLLAIGIQGDAGSVSE